MQFQSVTKIILTKLKKKNAKFHKYVGVDCHRQHIVIAVLDIILQIVLMEKSKMQQNDSEKNDLEVLRVKSIPM